MKINRIGKGVFGNISFGRSAIINGFSFSTKNGVVSGDFDGGEQVSEPRSVEAFDEIVSTAAADVVVSFADRHSVVVKGSEKAVAHTVVDVRRGVLVISSSSGVVNGRVTVEVVLPSPLNKIELKGAGDAEIEGMDQDAFTAILSGAGDLGVSGRAAAAVFVLTGAGDVDASDLDAESIDIETRGAGDVRARASRRVCVDASGAGDVSVKGGAKDVSSRSRGAGDVTIR